MNSPNSAENDFLTKLTEIVEANITGPQFGVSLLAKEMGMSRSNLHRKVNEVTKITVSQFINQVRLKKAKEILRHTTNTVSEVAYEVGFSNVSYFIKRFHEFYGYSPGEVGNRSEAADSLDSSNYSKKQIRNILIAVVSVIVLAVTLYIVSDLFKSKNEIDEKSIAVLPFTDSSPKEGNEYIINGLRSDIIDKLEKIKKLRVIPGIYTEKYSNSDLTIKEIAKNLNADYILCGTGQTIESSTKINLELIEVNSGNYQWTKLYIKDLDGKIFDLQNEVALDVADELKVKISPDEKARIVIEPTENKTAADFYYQGLQKQNTDAESAISFFEKAVVEDNEFALAYAELANTYSLLDTGINTGKYTILINNYADKAILFDNKNDKCLIQKAKTQIAQNNIELAIDYLEKAVEFNPNSAVSYRLISRWSAIGGQGLANPQMCVENAYKAIKYNLLEEDPDVKAFDYALLARALRTAGFYAEAFKNMDIALKLNPKDNYTLAERCEIIIDSTRNYNQAINLLKENLFPDSTDFRTNVYLLKNYFQIGDYQNALKHFNILDSHFDYQPSIKELSRLVVIYKYFGMNEKSDSCLEVFEKSINDEKYGDFGKAELLIRLFCIKNDIPDAIDQLKKLNQHKYIFSNNIRLLEDETIFEPIRQHPEFQRIISEMEDKFAKQKEQIRKSMVEKGLM